MLQISQSAATAVENLRAAQGIPETHAVRLSGGSDGTGQPVVSIEFVETPREADQVTEQSGTQVYVAPEIAEPLSDAVMDVQDLGDGPQLMFREAHP